MNRVLLRPEELAPDGRTTLRDGRAAHLRDVLKVAVGDRVRVGLLDGPRGEGVVASADAEAIALRCVFEDEAPAPSPVHLILALPRPKVLKRLWAPLASFGLARITLVNAAKVESAYFATHWLQPAHYTPLLVEGLQQAGLTRLPVVRLARRFRPFVEDELGAPGEKEARLVGHPDAVVRWRDWRQPPAARRVTLAIGPEGGWTPFELGFLAARGFQGVTFGSRILRSDVATIAAVALVIDRFDA